MTALLDRMWETFLPIEAAPAHNGEFAVAVINAIREDVRPIVRRLQGEGAWIDWFSFLVHGSLVAGDARACIHLRVALLPGTTGDGFVAYMQEFGPKWNTTRQIEAPEGREIAGISRSYLIEQNIERAWYLIGAQAKWVLSVVEQYDDTISCIELQKEFAQYLHFFSNVLVFPDRVPAWLVPQARLPSRWQFLWAAVRGVFRRG